MRIESQNSNSNEFIKETLAWHFDEIRSSHELVGELTYLFSLSVYLRLSFFLLATKKTGNRSLLRFDFDYFTDIFKASIKMNAIPCGTHIVNPFFRTFVRIKDFYLGFL